FFTLAGLREQLAEVDRQVALQQRQFRDMTDREAAGAASQLDLDRARSRLEETRAGVPPLQAGITAQLRRLALVLGAPPSYLDQRGIATKPLPRKLPMIRTGLPADLVMRRPDLRQAERELAAATEDIGVATANFYPRFSLLGSPTANTSSFGNLFEPRSFDLQVGPGVSWSILSGGRNRAIVEAADARQKQALYRYEKAVIAAIGEVDTEIAALRADQQRLAIVQRAREAAADAARRVRETHEAGALDFVDVLVEEERLRTARIAEIRVKSQLLLVWTRFHKALGGGWR
ncbi:MAG: TolC family protein, partial [Akkermansiaceae bacterium]|nr:TolC family protein [Akkermansiaceae bacterium]